MPPYTEVSVNSGPLSRLATMEEYSLTAEVLEVTGLRARLSTGGQTFDWPAEQLPPGVRPGETVTLKLLTPALAAAEQHERARAILTEILGGNS